MKKLLSNRAVVGMAAIFLSITLCFGLTNLLSKNLSQKTQVIRLCEDVGKGQMIQKDMTEIIEVGGYNLSTDVLKDQEVIIGKFAKSDLYKGDYLTAQKLSDGPLVNYAYLYDFDGSTRAISISVKSFAAGLSGKLEEGDIISVLATDYGQSIETLLLDELRYVQVLAVTAASGLDTQEYSLNEEANQLEDKELPTTITLKVSEDQAKLLADLEANGKIHIAFVYRGDEATSQSFLDEQANLIKQKLINTNKEVGEISYE